MCSSSTINLIRGTCGRDFSKQFWWRISTGRPNPGLISMAVLTITADPAQMVNIFSKLWTQLSPFRCCITSNLFNCLSGPISDNGMEKCTIWEEQIPGSLSKFVLPWHHLCHFWLPCPAHAMCTNACMLADWAIQCPTPDDNMIHDVLVQKRGHEDVALGRWKGVTDASEI